MGDHGERGWQTTKTHTTFDDDYGVAAAVDDSGDLAVTGDEKCTTTTYDRNVTANVVTQPKRVLTTALPCGKAPASVGDVIADQVSTYDSGGGVTLLQTLQDWTPSGGTTYQDTTKTTYDPFGRPLSTTDARKNVTATAYTPPARGPVTSIKTTSPKKWVTTTTTTPYWGTTATITDPNGRASEQDFDPLGRVVAVWSSGWPKPSHQNTPSTRYAYCAVSRNSEPCFVRACQIGRTAFRAARGSAYEGGSGVEQVEAAALDVVLGAGAGLDGDQGEFATGRGGVKLPFCLGQVGIWFDQGA